MEIALVLTVTASLIHITAFVIYDVQTFKKMTDPNIASWAIWAVITILNFTSYSSMSQDWMKNVLPMVGSMFCILTFVIAFTKGGKLSALDPLDKAALVIGMIAALAWYALRSATYANLIVQSAVMLGFIPTLRNAEKERPLPWLLWTAAFVFGTTLVVVRWRGHWADLVYPVGCIFAHLAVAIKAMRAPQVNEAGA